MNEESRMRVGCVSSVDENNCTVRVVFPDASNLVSGPLQMIIPFSQKNHAYYLPDINEQVFCLLMGNGVERGICLGAVYSKKDQPICKNRDRYYIEFEGGAHILIDRKEKVVQIQGFCGEFLKFDNGSMFLDLPGVISWLNGDMPTLLEEE